MRRWWLVLLLLLSVGLNLGLLAQRGRAERRERQARIEARGAQHGERGERGERGGPTPLLDRLLERMVQRVGVEGDDKEKFVALQKDFFTRTLGIRERLRQSQKALRENLRAENPDRQLADRQLAELAAAQQEIEKAFVDNFFASSQMLDPGQRQRYREWIGELRRARWDRPGRRELLEDGAERRRHRRESGEDRDGRGESPENPENPEN